MSRQSLVEQAKQADKERQVDAMVDIMLKLAQQFPNLTLEERNMLNIAYKNATAQRREALRRNPADAQAKRDLESLCNEILALIERLLPAADSVEAQVFYYKLKGDYLRYLNEIRNAGDGEAALRSYLTALDLGKRLPPHDPLVLAVALNTGVLYYETLGQRQRGFDFTKDYFERAYPTFERLTDEGEKNEVGFTLSLLRDNILLWSKELNIPLPQQ